jgi:pyridoxal phosphate enzyme (YggS family)
MPPGADIAENLLAVRRRIDAAAHRAHRSPSDIQLVAVSKTFSADFVRIAASLGQRAFGENRVQEAVGKIDALADLGLDWHLVGHLQSNKARRAATAFSCIESIDSVDLVTKVDRAAAEQGTRTRVLIQVDLARETTKYGIDESVVMPVVSAAAEARAIRLSGLMIVPPIPDQPEDSRPWFSRLRALRDRLVSDGIPPDCLADLSMGMSHDFEVAIEEGATIVRVGTAIFGRRPAAGSDT